MRNQKTFIALTSEIHEGQTVHLRTSSGESLTDAQGIDVTRALDFLFNLRHKRKRAGGVAFVCYGFARDFEFIFSTLPKDLRDKLFQSYRVKKEINELEYEIENILDDYYRFDPDSNEFQLADFELYVNQLALDELVEVEYEGYIIELANGKFLTIKKNKKSITIYDISGFFKPVSLQNAVWQILKENQPLLDRNTFDALDFFDGETEIDRLSAHAAFEVGYVQRLAARLNEKLQEHEISLSRWHGASALASKILSSAKAKSQFHNYRHRRQLSPELNKALYVSTYGGRAEQFKIGTLRDVYVYDINSAYANAASMLPVMLSKPQYQAEWNSTPFSLWYCEYDFTDVKPYFGFLPNREQTNFTKFKLQGRGYFWQPEIEYVAENYPQCIRVGHGYALEAEVTDFSLAIRNWYHLRNHLKQQNDPLEKILKMALTSVAGKFWQHNGKGYYYNLFYAAYITSVTRAQLLKATKGYEQDTICFQTDAVHTVKILPAEISDELGAYKVTHYDQVTYLDCGVYQCRNDGDIVKTKTKGFRRFDFNAAFEELKHARSYTALLEIFIGHNLYSKNPFIGKAQYLQDYAQSKTTRPTEKDLTAMRWFDIKDGDVDLTETFIDSRPVAQYNGLMSAPYNIGRNPETDSCLNTIEAGRI